VTHSSGMRHACALGAVTVPVAGTMVRQEAAAQQPTSDKVDNMDKRGQGGNAGQCEGAAELTEQRGSNSGKNQWRSTVATEIDGRWWPGGSSCSS
jgi:hypothetical protein